MNDGYK